MCVTAQRYPKHVLYHSKLCVYPQRVSRLWSIRIAARDQNHDWNVSRIFEMQEEDVAPGAADRDDTRAVSLGVEEERRKRQRHALLSVLAAVRRRVWTFVTLLYI